MTNLLLDQFEKLTAYSNQINSIRMLVLKFAIEGSLLEQDASDEPASHSLKRMVEQRNLWIAERRIKRSKPIAIAGEGEWVKPIPDGWAIVKLGQIGDWGAGATPNRRNPEYYGGSIPWFKSGELTNDEVSVCSEFITEKAMDDCSLRFNKPGDVLMAMYGATIGKTGLLTVSGTTNQAVCACTCFEGMHNKYLQLLLKAMRPMFVGRGEGGAQPNISKVKIINTVVAIPPFEEQKRIVAKADELINLCNKLESYLTRQEELGSRLVQAVVAAE